MTLLHVEQTSNSKEQHVLKQPYCNFHIERHMVSLFKIIGESTDFFLRKVLHCLLEKYSSVYFTEIIKSICDFHVSHKKIKTVMDFSQTFCKSQNHINNMWFSHKSVEAKERPIIASGELSSILWIILVYVFFLIRVYRVAVHKYIHKQTFKVITNCMGGRAVKVLD